MIIGIGIDSVEIDRFDSWSTWSKNRLSRLFCEHEIEYACSKTNKKSERLAGRFAVREALYKALTPILLTKIPFLSLCSCLCIKSNPAPVLVVDWSELVNFLTIDPKNIAIHVSITHTKSLATALILLDRVSNPDSN